MEKIKDDQLNKFSRAITQDDSLPAAQAMLHGIGLTDADLKKAQVGIVSTGWEGNPCNMHLNKLALDVKQGVKEADLVGLIFHTIGVSDGISMGTDGTMVRCGGRDCGLRQKYARRDDGFGSLESPFDFGVWRHDCPRLL